MSTAQKLTYLNDTKGLLKDSINSLGGNITSQTTFRQYATELDSIYSKLPKVSGTGSILSLSPTLKGRITSTLKGNTLQDGTPTPDSPVEIQSVTGLQKVSVCGKNLLPLTNQDFTYNSVRYYVQNGSLYLNGTSTGETNTTSINYKNNFSFYLDAGTYIISMKTRSVRLPLYVMKYSDDTELTVINGYNLNNKTFTLTERTQIYFGFYIYNQVFNQDDIEVQLEKGTEATEYEPYQSQTKELNLGKNLFDIDYMTQKNYNVSGVELQNYYTNNNGVLTISRNNYTSGRTLFNKLTLNAGTYTLSFNVSSSGTDKSFWRSVRDMEALTDIVSSARVEFTEQPYYYSISFTLNETKTIGISINPNESNTGTLTISNIQLEKGSQATSYSSYFTPIHLYENDQIIGTPYNWSIKRQIGSVVLDGTESYGNDGLVSTVRRYTLPLTNVKLNDNTNPKLSDYFKYVFDYNLDEPHFYITNAGTLYIFSNYTDGTQFKNWLSTAKPEFEYPLATETTEPITNQEIINQLNEIYYLQSYNGTTNITITSEDLELIMTASAIKGE